ncbi:MAG: Ig-like domain-containing protein [Coriobacteriales bacterium]|jgi:hypothetical protein|nr:Ig-like domain-containing protein [Coriobacteriales bacterium]
MNMRKRIGSLVIAILLSVTLVPAAAFAADRQTGSEWYPASSGWETKYSSNTKVVQIILVPFTLSDRFNPNALRAFALKVLAERNSATTVRLTYVSTYSGTAYTDAKNVAPGTYSLCLLVSASGQSSPVVDLKGEVVVRAGTLDVPATGITLNRTSTTLKVGGTAALTATVSPTDATDKALTWKSSAPTVAKVDSAGKVTALKSGTAVVSATTGNGISAQCSVTVLQSIGAASVAKVADKAFTGRQVKPAVTVKVNGKTLKNGTDYTLRYGSNKNIGKGTIVVTGKGAYTDNKTVNFNIVPTKNSLSKIAPGARQMKVTWKKVPAAQKVTKYQVRYRMQGAVAWKTKTYSASASSATIKGLAKGKAYQVQVRSVKTVSRVNYCSPWSTTKGSGRIR